MGIMGKSLGTSRTGTRPSTTPEPHPQEADDQGLREELHEDVRPLGPERPLEADLGHAFRHGSSRMFMRTTPPTTRATAASTPPTSSAVRAMLCDRRAM